MLAVARYIRGNLEVLDEKVPCCTAGTLEVMVLAVVVALYTRSNPEEVCLEAVVVLAVVALHMRNNPEEVDLGMMVAQCECLATLACCCQLGAGGPVAVVPVFVVSCFPTY
jgi:hypothetical protein